MAGVLFLGFLVAISGTSAVIKPEPDHQAQAIYLCEQQLTRSSRFPDQATFPGSTITDITTNKWVVGGTMQAPNM
ncbi:hypothetical protein [Rhodococcus sp. ACT016]|uniref:hypothetical protein n=1 Tax=Rhodococcus sp. ACT016 TaxID=3134808 RepID=UPI003D2AED40